MRLRQMCRRCAARRGSVAVELILVFPILVGFLFGTIEFSLLLHTRQQLLDASREGARVAARGGTNAEVIATVKQALGGTGPLADNATVDITPFSASPPNIRDGVTVCVSIVDAQVVPNMLPWLIDLTNESMMACTTMNLE
jgi:Flp pilus assembly protein TadG